MSAFDHGRYMVHPARRASCALERKNKMLDYQSVREKKATVQDLVKGLTKDDLRRELNEMYDELQRRIGNVTDADVIFEPVDPDANDPHAVEGEEKLPWTLGHVIVHLTASMEEAASVSQELARGVEYHGRSRWEVPFRRAKTIAFCRARLEESRRMSLAALHMWPDTPHLDNTFSLALGTPSYTAISRFALGLKHASDHLEHISKILRQAKEAAHAKI